MTYRALIVDDEALARSRLKRLLEEFPDILTVVGEAKDAEEAMEQMRLLAPDVLFLDIQMPGSTGLEMVAELKDPPYVIFTTAYDEYALQAFEVNSIDYLLKPIEKDRLRQALEKLQRLTGESSPEWERQLQQVLAKLNAASPRKLPVRLGDRVVFLDYEDIYFLKAENKYVSICTFEKRYVHSETLSQLENKLPTDVFVRIHRSVIININYVKEVQRWFAGKYRVIMKDKRRSELPLSRKLKHRLGL